MRPIAKCQPQSLRIGFLRKSRKVNTHEAFLCLALMLATSSPGRFSLALEAREKRPEDEVAKLAISNFFVSSPGSVFHPCGQIRRNTRRYWTQQTLPIARLVPLEGLMMPFRELCSRPAA